MNKTLIVGGMLTTIINLFSCTGQAQQNDTGISKEMDGQSAKAPESIKKWPTYKQLTAQLIDTTSDESLIEIVIENLFAEIPSDHISEYATVMSWNKSKQAIYLAWKLELEVNNGGYNQFYYNSKTNDYKLVPGALRLIGAPKFADLTERANLIYEKENEKITKQQDGTMEGFSKSYNDNPLSIFDTQFYELVKNGELQKIEADYIRKNKQEFIDK